jgi:hypothetical protein
MAEVHAAKRSGRGKARAMKRGTLTATQVDAAELAQAFPAPGDASGGATAPGEGAGATTTERGLLPVTLLLFAIPHAGAAFMLGACKRLTQRS